MSRRYVYPELIFETSTKVCINLRLIDKILLRRSRPYHVTYLSSEGYKYILLLFLELSSLANNAASSSPYLYCLLSPSVIVSGAETQF
jgi:hypothetical protein